MGTRGPDSDNPIALLANPNVHDARRHGRRGALGTGGARRPRPDAAILRTSRNGGESVAGDRPNHHIGASGIRPGRSTLPPAGALRTPYRRVMKQGPPNPPRLPPQHYRRLRGELGNPNHHRFPSGFGAIPADYPRSVVWPRGHRAAILERSRPGVSWPAIRGCRHLEGRERVPAFGAHGRAGRATGGVPRRGPGRTGGRSCTSW